MYNPEYLSSMAKKWKCICPGCGKKHIQRIYYTGNIIPPLIRCNDCNFKIRQMPSEEIEYKIGLQKNWYG